MSNEGPVPDVRVVRQRRPLLSVVEVSKSFGSTHALRGVTLDLRPGEVHALVGENGAGKSTLIKIITGLYRPDSGDISVDGDAVELRSAADAQALGIACIYQEPLVFPDLSVSENIFMNSGGAGRLVHWRDMHRRAGEILRQLEVDIDPRCARIATHGRSTAGRRDRQGDVARCPGPDHGRADGRAVGTRGATPVPAGSPSHRSRASPCCSSATASTRCSSSATGSPFSATASTSPRSRLPTSPR